MSVLTDEWSKVAEAPGCENGKTLKPYSPPEVDRIWGVWGSYYNIFKAIFYLLKGDYQLCTFLGTPNGSVQLTHVWGFERQGSEFRVKDLGMGV